MALKERNKDMLLARQSKNSEAFGHKMQKPPSNVSDIRDQFDTTHFLA